MTSDPASILTDRGSETGKLIARIALDLVQNTRDEGIVFRERPKGKEKASENIEVQQNVPRATLSNAESGEASLTLTRALSGKLEKPKSRTASLKVPAIGSLTPPLFGGFLSQQHWKLQGALRQFSEASGKRSKSPIL
jgi:hypothetical protein